MGPVSGRCTSSDNNFTRQSGPWRRRDDGKRLDLVFASWIVATTFALVGMLEAENIVLWALIALSLPGAVILIGGRRAPAVILLNLGLFWASIYCSLLSLYLAGRSQEITSDETRAIAYSLVALLALALGFRMGYREPVLWAVEGGARSRLRIGKVFCAYLVAEALNTLLTGVAFQIPSLTQPILAVTVLKLLALYILCSECLVQRRARALIVAALAIELTTGATNFIASYQPSFVVVLAAILDSAGGRFSLSKLFAAGIVLTAFFGASVFWTAIKPEYRTWMATTDSALTEGIFNRLAWMSGRFEKEIDFNAATIKLAERIGYTQLYSLAMPRLDANNFQHSPYWVDAVESVLMPRALFPGKPIEDDTRVTTEMTGVNFSSATSVSIGYVAEAQADFGIPGMFGEIIMIGYGLARFAGYLTKAKISLVGRQAFVAAALAYKFFYQANIDKAFATFVLQALALLLFLRFGYSLLESWFAAEAGRPPIPRSAK
jgi:hypothetical protein